MPEKKELSKGNSQEDGSMPPPPEPEFFDDLTREEKGKFLLQEFFEQPWVRWAVAIVAPVILLIFFLFHSGPKRKERLPIQSEEKPQVVTRAAMDRAIEAARKEDDKMQDLESTRNIQPIKKRNYGTNIEVYVYQKEKEGGSLSRSRQPDEMRKPLGIPSGTKIPALLSNRVFSFNVAAPVLALVSKDFTWQDKILIPKDSKFLGEASVLKSLDRINVSFDLLIFPDGRQMRVRAMALSEDGSGGIKGKVEKHRDVKVLKAIGETFLGGASLFVGSGRRDPYNLEDQLRGNLAQNLTNQASQDLHSVKTEQSITVEAYTPIQVIILEAI